MKKVSYFIIAATLIVSFSLVDGFAFKLGGKEVVKNGTGRRTMAIIGTIYYASLYVPESLKGKSAKDIIEADQPMSVIMKIDTRFLTKEKFIKAIMEGFDKAAASGYTTDKKAQFINMINTNLGEVKKYDSIYLNYIPGAGLTLVYKSAEGATKNVGTVSGVQFKKALFAIWLGPNPVQAALKNGMLGQ